MSMPLWIARLLGRPARVAPAAPEPRGQRDQTVQLLDRTARMAEFAIELEERDRRIRIMREEYARLEAESARASAAATDLERARIFERLAPSLATLNQLADLAAAGRPPAVGDLLAVYAQLRTELERLGLKRIGEAGAETAYDDTAHRPLDDAAIPAGAAVVVRVPGFRAHGKTLLKAVVSRRP